MYYLRGQSVAYAGSIPLLDKKALTSERHEYMTRNNDSTNTTNTAIVDPNGTTSASPPFGNGTPLPPPSVPASSPLLLLLLLELSASFGISTPPLLVPIHCFGGHYTIRGGCVHCGQGTRIEI
jgi:hypothetical protein